VRLRAAGARLEPGEVRQQRSLDRLEELQRRACDQQHVEDEARYDGVLRRQVARDDGGVEQRLLGEHDRQHRDREAATARDAQTCARGRLCRPTKSDR
jgi:hypothetical protein